MPTPVFPSSLPNVVMSNFGFKPTSAVIRTEMESGLARVRRRFISAPTDFAVMWKFTMKQMGVFEKFFDDTLFAGASWFTIKLVNGFGEQEYTARFKEGTYDAKIDTREGHWEVSATLEVVKRPTENAVFVPTPRSVEVISSVSAPEGSRVVFTVHLSDVTQQQETYAYALSGTATAPVNYNSAPILSNGVTRSGSNLIVPVGVSAFTFALDTVNDSITTLDLTIGLDVGGKAAIATVYKNIIVPPSGSGDGTVINQGESIVVGAGQAVITQYPIIFNGNGFISFAEGGSISGS